jgi:hypothetical protein
MMSGNTSCRKYILLKTRAAKILCSHRFEDRSSWWTTGARRGEPDMEINLLLVFCFCFSQCRYEFRTKMRYFLVYFPYFEKMKVGLCDLNAVCVSVNPPPINFWNPEPIYMKLGMYIMAPMPISTACFINSTHQSVCLRVYPSYR